MIAMYGFARKFAHPDFRLWLQGDIGETEPRRLLPAR